MTKILVSACLLGVNCRYDGENKYDEKVVGLFKKESLIPVCPEQLGGLPTPREPAGIYIGSGYDVISNRALVKTTKKEDVTDNFIRGAKETLEIAKRFDIKEAILKQKSPSCGCGITWRLNEDFENHSVEGFGVTAALLKRNGIRVLSEEDI